MCIVITIHIRFRHLALILLAVCHFCYVLVAVNIYIHDNMFDLNQTLLMRTYYPVYRTIFATPFSYVLQFGGQTFRHIPEHAVPERNSFMFFWDFHVKKGEFTVPVFFFMPIMFLLRTLFVTLFCLHYNMLRGGKNQFWATLAFFVTSVVGFCLESGYYADTNGCIGLIHLTLMSIVLLIVAGIRKDIKLIFLGIDRIPIKDSSQSQSGRVSTCGTSVCAGADLSQDGGHDPQNQTTNKAPNKRPLSSRDPVVANSIDYDYIDFAIEPITPQDINVEKQPSPAKLTYRNRKPDRTKSAPVPATSCSIVLEVSKDEESTSFKTANVNNEKEYSYLTFS
ncbi:uncharacterized protein LOC142350643 isoform X2 [Convolutriloba macropyga]|uniref:uncharacterized protein LOC142350643 isoform X2 n=1 Tax=Convolutriloba macropyga TaxID=536237 RepID=UPI003F527682